MMFDTGHHVLGNGRPKGRSENPLETSDRKLLFLHNERLQLLAFEIELFVEQCVARNPLGVLCGLFRFRKFVCRTRDTSSAVLRMKIQRWVGIESKQSDCTGGI
jgi:hypothetical protein